MSTDCLSGNKMHQDVWKLIEDKFNSLSPQDEFWKNTLQQLPVQTKSGIELKNQVVNFYHKVRKGFEGKHSETQELWNDLRPRLEILAEMRKNALQEEDRLVDLGLQALIDRNAESDPQARREKSDKLFAEAELHKATQKNADHQIEALCSQKDTLRRNLEPITKLYTHCILVAHNKAHLSRLYNADWQKYFPKE